MTQVSKSAAGLLLRDKEDLARAVTQRLYQEKPSLLEKHGERGREKCLQDMHYNIEYLRPAVELEDPALFVRYVEWLDEMLRARNVDTDDVVRCLVILRDECTARYDDEGVYIGGIIEEGLTALSVGRE
jgi:hypothetical protein